MRRREFIALVGGTTVALSFTAGAQQGEHVQRIGVLMGFAETDPTARSWVKAFRDALAKLGWTEGSNIRLELRWAAADPDRIRTLAKELVELRPDGDLRSDHTGDGRPCSRDADNSDRVRLRRRSNR
jgi:putative tryptophan/tyrosine transport system substrate-binding protein